MKNQEVEIKIVDIEMLDQNQDRDLATDLDITTTMQVVRIKITKMKVHYQNKILKTTMKLKKKIENG